MQTPALREFLSSTGHLVHNLNTAVVGLSSVESGVAVKPSEMDIAWSPKDCQVSGRQARAFVVKASIVFLAEAINVYLSQLIKYPGVEKPTDWTSKDRAERIESVCRRLNQEECVEVVGCILVAHWRNRLIHRTSRAGLTDRQRKILLDASGDIASRYKNLEPHRLLEDFAKGRPTLKDASSLTAMSINWIRSIDRQVPEPTSADDLKAWLDAASLYERFDAMRRISAAKGKQEHGMVAFISTHCPHLREAFDKYGASVA